MPCVKLILTLVHNILEKPHQIPNYTPLITNKKTFGKIGKLLSRITLTTFIIAPRCFSFFNRLTKRYMVKINAMTVMMIRQILNMLSVIYTDFFLVVP